MKSQANSKQKILVVDDKSENLDRLYHTFDPEYKVLKAVSGPVALEILARESNVAVIISAQDIPLMSGTEFLSRTTTQYPDIVRLVFNCLQRCRRLGGSSQLW